jgi:hypothetical protein
VAEKLDAQPDEVLLLAVSGWGQSITSDRLIDQQVLPGSRYRVRVLIAEGMELE